MERVTGIEPAFSAWEADVLPLNYTRRCTFGSNYIQGKAFNIERATKALIGDFFAKNLIRRLMFEVDLRVDKNSVVIKWDFNQ